VILSGYQLRITEVGHTVKIIRCRRTVNDTSSLNCKTLTCMFINMQVIS